MSTKTVIVVVGVLLGLTGFGWLIHQAFPRYIERIHTDTMTTYVRFDVPIEKIVYRNLPAHIETVFVKHPTSDNPQVADSLLLTAHLDTIIGPYQDSLALLYAFPPRNWFGINFRPTPRPVEVKTQTITITKEVEKSQFLGGWPERILVFSAGFGAGRIK